MAMTPATVRRTPARLDALVITTRIAMATAHPDLWRSRRPLFFDAFMAFHSPQIVTDWRPSHSANVSCQWLEARYRRNRVLVLSVGRVIAPPRRASL
jgi:hypothetical protein